MKNILLLLSLFASLQFMAQTNSVDAILLQKCLDLPELQEFYPLEPSGEMAQIYILQHGVSFPTNIGVTKKSRAILFLNKADVITQNIDAYFVFWTFDVQNENKARIEFNYNASIRNNTGVSFVLDFVKANNEWSVINSKITRR